MFLDANKGSGKTICKNTYCKFSKHWQSFSNFIEAVILMIPRVTKRVADAMAVYHYERTCREEVIEKSRRGMQEIVRRAEEVKMRRLCTTRDDDSSEDVLENKEAAYISHAEENIVDNISFDVTDAKSLLPNTNEKGEESEKDRCMR